MPTDTCPLFLKHGEHGKVVALDLDDTLFSGRAYLLVGLPLPNVLSRLEWLQKRGYEIFIHTSRINSEHGEDIIDQQLEIIAKALMKHGLPAFPIWSGRGKPLACHYVDNKAWQSVGSLVINLEWKEKIR